MKLLCNCNNKVYCDKYSLLTHQQTDLHKKNIKSKCISGCNCDTCVFKKFKKEIAYLSR